MLLTFDEDVRNKAQIVCRFPVNVGNELNVIVFDFLASGINAKLCATFAQKLDMEYEAVKDAVESLMFIVSQASRFSLTESDFEESLASLGFDESIKQCLINGFHEHKLEIRQILSKMDRESNALPIYSNVEWRSEVLLSSRMLKDQYKPRFILKFEFDLGKDKKSYVTVQCDAANLVHLHDTLEEAFMESRSQHVLKMLRLLK